MTGFVEGFMTCLKESLLLLLHDRALGEPDQVIVRFFTLRCRIGIAGSDKRNQH